MEPEESSHVELSVCLPAPYLVLGALGFGELLSTSDSLSNALHFRSTTTDQQTPEIVVFCV